MIRWDRLLHALPPRVLHIASLLLLFPNQWVRVTLLIAERVEASLYYCEYVLCPREEAHTHEKEPTTNTNNVFLCSSPS